MKPLCVIPVDGDGARAAKGLPLLDAGGDPVAVALEALGECSVVAVAGRGAWRVVAEAYRAAKARGFNPFRLTGVDTDAEPLLAGIPANRLLVARTASKTMTRHGEAGYRLVAGKPLDRRGFLRGTAGLREYINTPRIASPSACQGLRYCGLCVEACPFQALEEKPPRADPDRCTGCGLCLSTCPVRVLESTGTSSGEIESFVKTVAPALAGKKVLIVFSCPESIDEALQALRGEAGKGQAALFIPLYCPGEAVFDTVAGLVAGGASIAFYCSGGWGCRGWEEYRERVLGPLEEKGYVSWPIGVEELVEAYRETGEKGVGFDPEWLSKPATRRVVAVEAEGETIASIPLWIRVDGERCDLCSACVHECPTGALYMREEGDRQELVYNPLKCIGCDACSRVCPYSALETARVLPAPSTEQVLAWDEIARCIVCGRPIGSKKLVEAVARKMREMGLPDRVVVTAYMCNECKVKYQLGLVEPREKP